MKPTIKERLTAHLRGDGTINDLVVDDLYREAHHISEDHDTDLETVERWAVDTCGLIREKGKQ